MNKLGEITTIIAWISSWKASLTMGPISMAEMLADVAKLWKKSMKDTPLFQGGQDFDSEIWCHLRISKVSHTVDSKFLDEDFMYHTSKNRHWIRMLDIHISKSQSARTELS